MLTACLGLQSCPPCILRASLQHALSGSPQTPLGARARACLRASVPTLWGRAEAPVSNNMVSGPATGHGQRRRRWKGTRPGADGGARPTRAAAVAAALTEGPTHGHECCRGTLGRPAGVRPSAADANGASSPLYKKVSSHSHPRCTDLASILFGGARRRHQWIENTNVTETRNYRAGVRPDHLQFTPGHPFKLALEPRGIAVM